MNLQIKKTLFVPKKNKINKQELQEVLMFPIEIFWKLWIKTTY